MKDLTSNKRIAVIIPVYNGEKYLEEAITSVLMQPCKDLFVIIVNDGSTDTSYKIAQSFAEKDERVFVIDQENQGVSVARNNGIDFAIKKGCSYIAFLDADDIWVKEFYTQDLFERIMTEDLDGYRFSFYLSDEHLNYGKKFVSDNFLYKKEEINKFSLYFCCYFYKSDFFKQNQVRFPVGIRVQEDEVFRYVALSLMDSIHGIDKSILVYRSNSSSVCHVKNNATNRYFSNVIPAWQWAKQELIRIKGEGYSIKDADLEGCDTMIKTFLSEYVQIASQQGVPLETIKLAINDSQLSYLYNDNSKVWCSENNQNIWESFTKHPRLFWLKNRIKGLAISFIKLFRNVPFVLKKRYPEKISNLSYSNIG